MPLETEFEKAANLIHISKDHDGEAPGYGCRTDFHGREFCPGPDGEDERIARAMIRSGWRSTK